MNIEDITIRKKKKTNAIRVFVEDDRLVCECPDWYTDAQVREFLSHHTRKLNSIMKSVQQRKSLETLPKFTRDDVQSMADEALKVIPPIVKKYAEIMGVTYGGITIRNQKTRWGSCSSKGNLNFNCYLMLFDEPEIEYIVVHELAHRKELNHSPAFWAIVESVLPDYREREARIKAKEPEIFARRTDI